MPSNSFERKHGEACPRRSSVGQGFETETQGGRPARWTMRSAPPRGTRQIQDFPLERILALPPRGEDASNGWSRGGMSLLCEEESLYHTSSHSRKALCTEKQTRYFHFRRGMLITHKFDGHFKYVEILDGHLSTRYHFSCSKLPRAWRIGASISWLAGSTSSTTGAFKLSYKKISLQTSFYQRY